MSIQYPVPIHRNFLPRAKQLMEEIKQRNDLLRELLTIAKEIQIEAGQIEEWAVIENLEAGWIVMQQPQTQPSEGAVAG